MANNVYIIAEISANHCGSKNVAKNVIKAAKCCGANAVKLQTFTADTITIDCDSGLFRTRPGLWEGKTLYELYQEAYMPWEWQGELKLYAEELGLELFSTPFDYAAVDYLESIGVSRYKIASPEAMDFPLVAYTAKKLKPMIISTGMSSLNEIQGAIDACKEVGNEDITILKCTSEYPAKLKDMNLMTITDMIRRFGPQGVKIGLSDHSMNNETVIAAVALGVVVIEKHLTLNRSMGGVDAGFSLNPDEFHSMVLAVKNTEEVLGEVKYIPANYRARGARSLFAVKDIKDGEAFTSENIRSIRPSNGLHPKYYHDILGKTAACDIAFGTPLTLELIEGKVDLIDLK